MIIDFKADPSHARRYDVVWAVDGMRVNLPIYYADDTAGIVRFYLMDEAGAFRVGPDRRPLIEERRAPIRIVLKPPGDIAEIEALERGIVEGAEVLRALGDTLNQLRFGGESWDAMRN